MVVTDAQGVHVSHSLDPILAVSLCLGSVIEGSKRQSKHKTTIKLHLARISHTLYVEHVQQHGWSQLPRVENLVAETPLSQDPISSSKVSLDDDYWL